MSILAEFRVPPEDFLLHWTLEAVPEMRVEIERVVVESQAVTPYFWAAGDDFAAFEDALEADPTIDAVEALDDDGDRRLYRVNWRENFRAVTYAVSDTGATILETEGGSDGWNVQILFPDEDSLSSFQDYAATHDVTFELARLRRSDYPEMLGKYGVTDEQYEALVTAYEEGYFRVPGEISLAELADELDVSKNAASARLRRGYGNLVENTLVHDG